MDEIIVDNIPLKDLIKIFERNEKLEIIELGDTGHPSDGFVDESYFKNIDTVHDLLQTDYNFKGLVMLKAKIRGLTIDYDSEKYKIKGKKKEIEKI